MLKVRIKVENSKIPFPWIDPLNSKDEVLNVIVHSVLTHWDEFRLFNSCTSLSLHFMILFLSDITLQMRRQSQKIK